MCHNHKNVNIKFIRPLDNVDNNYVRKNKVAHFLLTTVYNG